MNILRSTILLLLSEQEKTFGILISPEHDLVVVWRWHAGNEAEFARRMIAAIK